VEEWVLISPNKAGHPFHIHVNSFQLKERSTALEPDPTLVAPEDMATVKSRIEAMASNDPAGQWRDTALIPPQGYIRIWTRLYSKYVGKTVFHCHFLAHEETSMIQNFLIEEPKSQ
jgi:FtsP/CotA-like multicopper oxidase with cupredoxin domain